MSFFNTRFGARLVSVKYLNAPPPYVCRRVVSQEHNLATFDDVFILPYILNVLCEIINHYFWHILYVWTYFDFRRSSCRRLIEV